MSFEAVAMAVNEDRAKGNAKLILILLANCHNPVNGCYPSVAYLSSRSGLPENTVRNNLAKLQSDGVISVRQRKHASSEYTLLFSTIHKNCGSTKIGGKTVSKKEETVRNTPHTPQGVDGLFEDFWKQYPRKEGKGSARKAFAKAIKRVGGITKHLVIFSGLLTSPRLKREKQFVPHASTWLNDDGWEDEPEKQERRVY